MKLMRRAMLAVIMLVMFVSCRFYSLSGYTIEASTVSVAFFENQAPIQPAELSQEFTNQLEQKLIQETPLKLVREDGELQFSGAIIGYAYRPVAVSGVDDTEENELRITVNVEYIDTQSNEKSFTESFSATDTFDANSDLSSVEDELIKSISEQLVQSIFNKAFIDW